MLDIYTCMKSKIQLEIYESDVLKSIASQSKAETFDFVEKILNNYEYPTETAAELITRLEDYILICQRTVYDQELMDHMDDNGQFVNYGNTRKIPQVDHKPQKEDFSQEKPLYCVN